MFRATCRRGSSGPGGVPAAARKQIRIGVQRGGERLLAMPGLLTVEERELREREEAVLVAGRSQSRVQRRERPCRVLLVVLCQTEAIEELGRVRARRIRGERVRHETALDRLRVDALHADRRRARGQQDDRHSARNDATTRPTRELASRFPRSEAQPSGEVHQARGRVRNHSRFPIVPRSEAKPSGEVMNLQLAASLRPPLSPAAWKRASTAIPPSAASTLRPA